MKYTILKIEEDLDFGCEERAADAEVMAVVTLLDEQKEESVHRFPDQELYAKDIREGDAVILDEKGKLQKVPDSDWTEDCNAKTVDIPKFVDRMRQVKAGKEIDWICPFCGGQVGLLEQSDHHTVIGCHSCDMRITLDN